MIANGKIRRSLLFWSLGLFDDVSLYAGGNSLRKYFNFEVDAKLFHIMLQKTIQYATDRHQKVNHRYGDKPYTFHLNMVYGVAQKFSYLLPESEIENVYCGCWVHDIIEDARETYNDVLHNTNKTVAELAYALTNEKGRTRAERANDTYYQGIRETPNATFVKLCDRIANVKNSKEQGSSMLDKYRIENPEFIKKLYRPELQDMVAYLEDLLLDKSSI